MRRFEEIYRKGLVIAIYLYFVVAILFVTGNMSYHIMFIGVILFLAFIILGNMNANINHEFSIEMNKRNAKRTKKRTYETVKSQLQIERC